MSPPGRPGGDHLVTDEQAGLQRWIARELHDLVVQPLTNTLVELDRVDRAGAGPSYEGTETIKRELRAALHGLRHLMSELRGQSVDTGGLVPSVATLVADVRTRNDLDASLRVSPGWPSHLSPETTRNLHRIVAEALRNVVSHSGASWVEVRLEEVCGGLHVSVTDNGVLGSDTSGASCEGMGTQGMRERAVVIGGVLTIDHARSGSTVAVVVEEPVSVPASESAASVPAASVPATEPAPERVER